MSLGEYLGAGNGTTKLLLHLNGNSNDSSGNGSNGTDTAITYSQANGKFGQGAGFNGSTSYITTPNLSILLNSFTLSFWLKTTSTSFSLFENGWFSSQAGIWVHDDASFGIRNAGGTTADVTTTKKYSDGIYHNVVMLSNGTNLLIYIDGKQEGSVSSSGITNTMSNTLYIGRYAHASSGFYTGSLDEVIIENTAWSAEKIKKYYTNAKGRFGII